MAVVDLYNNYTPVQTFPREGQFRVSLNGQLLDADKWVEATAQSRGYKKYSSQWQGLYTEFWDIRNQTIEKNFQKLWQNSDLSGMPISGFTNVILDNIHDTISYKETETLGRQLKQWDTAHDIIYNGGHMVGFDLETMGDIRNSGLKTNGIFDITELAVGRRTYQGSDIIRSGESYLIGLSSEHADYYRSLVSQFKRQGWDSLNNEQQVALSRASMYATAQIGDNNGLKVIRKLGDSSMDAEKMLKGIQKLQDNYTDPYIVIKSVTQELFDAKADARSVIYGANSDFDIKGMVNVLNKIGSADALELAENIKTLEPEVLDVIYSARAMAAAHKMPVDAYLSTFNGVRTDATVQGQLKAYMFNADQTHYGIQDVHNEGELLVRRAFEVNDLSSDLHDRITQGTINKKYGMDSVLYFNHGKLQHETGLEFGTVIGNGQRIATPNMSFQGEYWQLDPERTGKMVLDNGEEKFFATFNNFSDVAYYGTDPTTFTIARDSEDELVEFIEKNATPFSYDELPITKKGTINKRYSKRFAAQQEYRYSDIGRREFDRLINPTDVQVSKKGDPINGFEGLKKYLGLKETLGLEGEIKPDTESANRIYNAILEYDANAVANGGKKLGMSYYNAQAYAAMYGRLENESALLNDLVNQIDQINVNPESANFERTLVLRRGYNHAINYMMENNTAVKSAGIKNISDMFGIDIEVGDKLTRVNMHSRDVGIRDIERSLVGLNPNGIADKETISDMLGGLRQRKLIDNKAYNDLLNSVDSLYSQRDIYGFSQDLFLKLSEAQQADEALREPGARLLQNFGEDFRRERIKSFRQGTFNDVYLNSAHNINVANSIASTPFTNYIDSSDIDGLTSRMDNLARRLNMTGNSSALLSEMFTGGPNNDKPYGIFNQKGISALLVEPDETHKNAYLLMTRQEDLQKLRVAVDSGELDFSSFKALTTGPNSVYRYAAAEELPYINKLALSTGLLDEAGNVIDNGGYGMGILQSVNQGPDFEKIIVPELSVYTDKRGITRGYFNDAAYEIGANHRKVGAAALDEISKGNYQDASRIFRNKLNSGLENMSSSAGYRAVKVNGEFHRIITYGPSDMIQGYQARVTNGLQKIFEATVMSNTNGITPENMNTAQQVVMHFGKAIGLEVKNNDYNRFLWNTMHGEGASYFNEFFQKRAFIGNVGSDTIFKNSVGPGVVLPPAFNRNLYDITLDTLRDTIGESRTSVNGLDKSLISSLEAVQDVVPFKYINQVLGESATEKGDISTIRPGVFNWMSESTNTMRPTYTQQNQGIPFMPEWIEDNALKRYNLSIGSNPLAQIEYDFRKAMQVQNTDRLIDYNRLERQFGGMAKQVSQWDLEQKYLQMAQDGSALYSKLGFSDVDEYNRVLQLFRETYSSLNEDSSFLAPALHESRLFKDREGIKVELDVSDDLNFERTRKTLLSLQGKDVDTDTIIGYRKTRYGDVPIYHRGATITYDRELIDKLLPEHVNAENLSLYIDSIGSGYGTPAAYGDMSVDKIFFNGIEKSVARSIDPEYVARQANIDLAHAKDVLNNMYDYAFDGAPIVANFGMTGHANPNSAMSASQYIIRRYYDAGETQSLANYLNQKIAQANTEYAASGTISPFYGMKQFTVSENGRLLFDTQNAANSVAAWDIVLNDLRNDYGPNPGSELNRNILAGLDYMDAHGLTYGTIQRQNMNEHMGKFQTIDQRIQQTIMLRNMDPNAGKLNDMDLGFNSALKSYSKNFEDYLANNNISRSGSSAFGSVLKADSMAKNYDRLHKIHGFKDMERSAHGLFMSIEDYYTPDGIKNLEGVIDIDITDIKPLRGGANTLDMQESIFFTEKGPSDFLIKKAGSREAAENIQAVRLHLGHDFTYSIPNVTAGGRTSVTKDYMVIPIQTVRAQQGQDKYFFQEMSGRTNRLVNKTYDIIHNPQKDVATELSILYNDYHKNTIDQIKTGNKESDLYRAFNQYFAPSSSQVQVRDISAPMLEDMVADKEMQSIMNTRQALERQIMSGDISESTVNQYRDVMGQFSDKLSGIAERIRTDDAYYSSINITNLSDAVKRAQTVERNGIKFKGQVVGVGRDALIAEGLEFDKLSINVLAEYEKSLGLHTGVDLAGIDTDFITRNSLASKRKQLVSDINALGLNINLNENESIIEQLDRWSEATLFRHDKTGRIIGPNTKKINQSIADGKKGVGALLDVFENGGLGEMYMSQVGTYGQMTRYPNFKSQPVAKILLDESVSGKEIRLFDPLFNASTNVDVDGDTMFAALGLRGGSVMGQSDEYYRSAKAAWEAFAVGTEINGEKLGFRYQFADLIEEGKGFKKEYVDNLTGQKLAMLETMDPENYNIAATKFLENYKELGFTRADIDDSKSIARFIFASSDTVNRVYNENMVNSFLNENANLASIASRIRKKNIGFISTPNYMIRDSLMRSLNAENTSPELRKKITNTIYDLTNMWQAKGGVLSIFEQDSIDTKKAIDALDIAMTARYQTGLSGLFAASRYSGNTSNILSESAQNIVRGGGRKIFGDLSPEQFNIVGKAFASTSYADFDTMVESISDTGAKKALKLLKGYRGMYEIASEVPVFNQFHNLTKGRVSEFNMASIITEILEGKIDASIFENTSGGDMLTKIFEDALRKKRGLRPERKFDVGNVYFASGKVFDNPNNPAVDIAHSVFVYNQDNTFTRLDSEGRRIQDETYKRSQISRLIDTDMGRKISLGEFQNDKSLRDRSVKEMDITRQRTILDRVMLNSNDEIRGGMPSNINIMREDSIARGLLDIDGTNTNRIIGRVRTMANAFDDAVSGGMLKPTGPATGAELLKSINEDIARNPKYHGMKYDEAVYEMMSDIFGSSDQLDRYMNSVLNMPSGFNRKSYLDAIHKLDENIFDIFKAQQDLEASFNNVQRELDDIIRTYTDEGVKDINAVQNLRSILNGKQATIDTVTNDLLEFNQQTIRGVQNTIYGQFDASDFQKQMSAMFQWNTPTNDTVVGFGSYMGKRFGALGSQDIKNIRTEAQSALNNLGGQFASQERYAIDQTIDALNNYKPAAVPNINFQRTSKTVGDITSEHISAIKASGDALNNIGNDIAAQIRRNADEVMDGQRKTVWKMLKDSPIGEIPDMLKGHGREVGIVVGAMAAIGVVNNILNHSNSKTPMSPRQSNRHPDESPNYDSSTVNSQAPSSPVAGTGQNTLYMDNQSGLQFKVSGKSRRDVSNASNAQFIAAAGGGQMNANVTHDMSGVNNNWLANKYAELSV